MRALNDPFVGRTIAQYEILARVGGGAMGVVYQARDTKLGRLVALKFLPQQWSHDDAAKQRFVREAQAASATQHPNICTIHDIETADDGQLFIVMAFYEGPTLKQRLEHGPMGLDEALEIATQLADGLAKAHAQGVIHRDIKPGNVILTEEGVRILDFGLAMFADALQLTVQNSTLGTVAYMSPEQIRGETVDARSDVWAAGVVLYEMLVGHVPFRGTHAEAIGYAIRNDAPTPLRSERPGIPEDVEQLVFRALHKDRSVRFSSGRELARTLRQVRGQTLPQELRTQPVPLPRHAPPLPHDRRSPWKVWAGVCAACVIAAAAAALILWPIERTNIVVAPFGNQTGDSDLDQYRLALTQMLTLSLSNSRELRVAPYSRVREILRRFVQDKTDISNRDSIQAITANTGAAIVVVPTLLRDGGAWRARVELRDGGTSTNIWEHETTPRTSSLTRDTAFQLATLLAVEADNHLKSPRTRIVDALMWLLPSGRVDSVGRMRSLEAAKAFEEGIAWYEDIEYAQARRAFASAVELDPRNTLLLAWLSRAAQLTRDETEATDAADRALAAITARTAVVDALFTRAVAAEAHRDTEAAERWYRALTVERPDDATWVIELAGFLARQTRAADAVAAYHHALMLDTRLPRPRLELCRMYGPARLNEPAEAKTFGEAALNGYRALGARAGEAQSLLCLADTLVAGRDEERKQARSYAESAHRIFDDLRYRYSASKAEYYLAYAAGALGQLKDSVALGEKALTHAREAGNTDDQARIMNNLGVAHVALGNRLEAADYYQQAYKLYQSWHDESRAARIQANRGALLIEYGNPDEGILDVRNALSVSEKTGDRNFQTFCLRVIATYLRNQGRHKEAIDELNKGLAIARERNLAENVTVMTIFLALSQFQTADYDAARRSLLDALKDGTGRRSTEARIRLAQTYVRLGDFAAAEAELAIGERELRAAPNNELRALLSLVRGEWAHESRHVAEARTSFEKASALWVETLPEPSAVEARAYLGFMNAAAGRVDAGRQAIRTSIKAADELGHLSLRVRCRLLLAEIEIVQRNFGDANDLLNAIASDEGGRTIGPELRARTHYLQAKLQAARGDVAGAAASTEAARSLIRGLEAQLPENYRASFAKREAVQRLTQ